MKKEEPKWMIRNSSGEKSLMATTVLIAVLIVFIKILLNGVVIGPVNFGLIDAGLVAAALTPTLGAYTWRRHTTAKTRNEKAIEFAKIASNPTNIGVNGNGNTDGEDPEKEE